jgi:hypothetical protein
MDIIKYDMRKRNYIDFNLRQYVSELFNEIPHEHKQITIGFSRDVATHLTETVEAILYPNGDEVKRSYYEEVKEHIINILENSIEKNFARRD